MSIFLSSLLALQPVLAGSITGKIRAAGFEPAGAVVYLLAEPADSLAASPDTAVIDQRDIAFLPRVSAIRPGTVVRFRNSDPILHNVFSPAGPGPGFDLGTYPSPGVRERVIGETGVHVILCHVHPEMAAFVVVVPTPYRAVSEPDGSFAIFGVPPGRYQLHVWRRLAAPVEREILITSGRTVEVEIQLVPARRRR